MLRKAPTIFFFFVIIRFLATKVLIAVVTKLSLLVGVVIVIWLN